MKLGNKKCGIYITSVTMKTVKIVAAVLLLCVVSVVSYWCGYTNNDTKNYEAACLQADFIRWTIDQWDGDTACWNIGAEIKEDYYEWFQELPNGNFKTKYITDLRQFEDYYWCY